jgi:hypothetical protein
VVGARAGKLGCETGDGRTGDCELAPCPPGSPLHGTARQAKLSCLVVLILFVLVYFLLGSVGISSEFAERNNEAIPIMCKTKTKNRLSV